jgi:hypothetical protein
LTRTDISSSSSVALLTRIRSNQFRNTMAASKLSPDERQRRKREAARLRQRRCRAKKKENAEIFRKERFVNKKTSGKLSISFNHTVPALSPERKQQPSPRRAIKEKNVTRVSLDLCSTTDEFNPSTPENSSHKVHTSSFSTPHSIINFPQMPPLPNIRNAAIAPSSDHNVRKIPSRARHACFSNSQVDESELTAADAMLALRHSPIPDSSRPKYALSPRTITRASTVHPPPILPGFNKTMVKTGKPSCHVRLTMNSQYGQDNPIARRQFLYPKDRRQFHFDDRVGRGKKLRNNLHLPPGIHFFYH